MPSEYFSTLHLIWMNIVLFIFSLFLFAVCLYACLFVRWVYKRRLRQKTDQMVDCYKTAELKQTDEEAKKLEEEPKNQKPKKKVHIVTKPCNQVIKKNANEYIVRRVNERAIGETACSPMSAPQSIQQPQFIVVPMNVGANQNQNRKHQRRTHSPSIPIVYPMPQRMVESVATQTSLQGEPDQGAVPLEKKQSDPDWLAGFDERDGEKVVLDEVAVSEKVMRKRKEEEISKSGRKKRNADGPKGRDADEARCSIENDAPSARKAPVDAVSAPPAPSNQSPPAPVSSASSAPTPAVVSDSTTPSVTASVPPLSGTPGSTYLSASLNSKTSPSKTSDSKGPLGSPVQSAFIALPGENIPSNNAPTKASRPSMFPYFVDSKAPPTDVSTGKSIAKLAEPRVLDSSDSSLALYRSRSKKHSQKVYKQPSTTKK